MRDKNVFNAYLEKNSVKELVFYGEFAEYGVFRELIDDSYVVRYIEQKTTGESGTKDLKEHIKDLDNTEMIITSCVAYKNEIAEFLSNHVKVKKVISYTDIIFETQED